MRMFIASHRIASYQRLPTDECRCSWRTPAGAVHRSVQFLPNGISPRKGAKRGTHSAQGCQVVPLCDGPRDTHTCVHACIHTYTYMYIQRTSVYSIAQGKARSLVSEQAAHMRRGHARGAEQSSTWAYAHPGTSAPFASHHLESATSLLKAPHPVPGGQFWGRGPFDSRSREEACVSSKWLPHTALAACGMRPTRRVGGCVGAPLVCAHGTEPPPPIERQCAQKQKTKRARSVCVCCCCSVRESANTLSARQRPRRACAFTSAYSLPPSCVGVTGASSGAPAPT